MKANKLTYDDWSVEYYPIEDDCWGPFLDSCWNGTIAPVQVEEIEVERLWFVNMEIMVWDETKSVWRTKQDCRVSPYRLTEQEADEDFNRLGCVDVRTKKVVRAQDIIVPNYLWLRFIVQCQSMNYKNK